MTNLCRCLLVAETIITRILKSHCKPHISVMALSLEAVNEFSNNSQSMKVVREEAIRSLDKIDRISKPILYEEFFQKYLVRNVPCILTDWATDGWLSRADWCHDGKISWDLLERLFGNAVAPVSNCNEQQSYSQAKTSMTIKDFVAYIKVRTDSRCRGEESKVLYLKDWHFTRDFPDYDAYITPPYFLSDWLNEFWKNRTENGDEEDDYRFVYIGPKDSWTPFHADVFRSYSWSANVCGRKRWILFAPGYEQQLQDKFGRLPFDLRKVECDVDRNPNSMENCFEVIQESGEILFVPSGWHHQVYNLEDTVSINHNWINGCNIDICWSYIKQRLHDVEVEIAEHRQMENWNKHCQLILRADSGMDYTDFYNLLLTVASKRLKQLCDLNNSEGSHLVTQNILPSPDEVDGGKYSDVIGAGHVLYDLLKIQFLLENELTSEFSLSFDADRIDCSPDELISRIKSGIAKINYQLKSLE